jgi:hypothetical protein
MARPFRPWLATLVVAVCVAAITAQQEPAPAGRAGGPPGAPGGLPPGAPPAGGRQSVPPLGSAAGPPPTPRASAPIDLTGLWVSIVNEDWRWRMVTAPKGDFPGIPLNPAGRQIAEAWDPATDGSCRAFGAAGLLRMPTRVRISWSDDTTLKVETDNGHQTRLLQFTARPAGGASLQGHSIAEWKRTLPPTNPFGFAFGGGPPPPPGGSLKVVTTNLSGGWLRRNGVPYSARATVTEYFDRFTGPDGAEWFVVTTSVDDPEYLVTRFVTSSHFRRETDASKWNPRRCKPV